MAEGFAKRLSWQLEAYGHTFVEALIRLLPAKCVFKLGECVGKIMWPFMRTRRATIIRNLRIACAPLGHEEVKKMAYDSFVRSFANLVSSSISPHAKGGKTEDMLVVENPEMLLDACNQGRGVVLLLSHMGNWELLTRMNQLFPKDAKSGAFYRPLNNLILNERVLKMREASGTRLFSKRDSLHQVGGFLRDNGVIGILADQRVGKQGEVVSFFGRLTRVSPLPSLLVRRCKSEVLALSLRTVEPGKWVARYHKVEQPYHSENCMKALEEAMKVSLIDVFWLQERWKTYIKKRITPKKWLEKEGIRSDKPHRAVYWLDANEAKPELDDEFVHADFEWEFVSGKNPQDLEQVDLSKPLPIDFIMTSKPNRDLQKAAKRLAIPVVDKSLFSK